MNPRAGDTVTSTKLPTITTTTNTTTTGVRRHFSHATLRPEAATSSKAESTPRKRRQQIESELEQHSTTRPRPEANTPPPQKTRRRATGVEQGEGMISKSRFGYFFSGIASHIHRPKNMETLDNPENQIFNTTDVTQSLKREGNEAIVQSTCSDFNKRRKVDIDLDEGQLESYKNDEGVKATVRDEKSSNDNVYDCKSLSQCGINTISNVCSKKYYNAGEFDLENKEENSVTSTKVIEKEKESPCEDSHKMTVNETIDNESNIDLPLKKIDTNEKNENKIIDMCRSIVASMCEKIQDTVETEMCEYNLGRQSTITIASEAFNLINDKNQLKFSAESTTNKEVNRTESDVNNKNTSEDVTDEKMSEKKRDRPREPEVKISLPASNSRPSSRSSRRDDTVRLRKSIQWLEEGARRLREDLASTRTELHEERRAARLARRELDTAIREAKATEASKYTSIISELRAKLSQSPSRSVMDSLPGSSKTEILKDENHRREMAAVKKRLAEAESTIQKLKTNSLDYRRAKNKNKQDGTEKLLRSEVRRLEVEVQGFKSANKKLEEKLHIAENSAKARVAELRTQHESHQAEMAALQKTLRSDTIKMIDEIQSKNREIEKLEKLVSESVQINQKLRTKEDETLYIRN